MGGTDDTLDDGLGEQLGDQLAEPSPLLHLSATLVAFGATTLVRRALDSGYRRATGHATPNANDPSSSLARTIAWAALTAATAAVVEVAVLRAMQRRR